MAERSRILGFGMIAVVALGYLAALALGVGLFQARPFIGGVATIVAIAISRGLLLFLPTPAVLTRRSGDR
jgi:hypothetical protein